MEKDMKIQRYTFEDALIKWGADKGRKEKAAVAMGLMLCSQLNWNKGGVLRWKTSNALQEVGVSRSTFYRTMPILVKAGWFYLDSQNNYQVSLAGMSHDETHSHNETEVSHDETNKSHEDNPFSEVYLFSEEQIVKEMDCRRATFPLDALVPFTLTTNARDEHKEKQNYPEPPSGLQKHFDRQARINAEILAEFGRAG